MSVIEISGLSKTYRSRSWRRGGRRPAVLRPALDGLDLLVESGGVHGFLGPNGSGKTTTIRVLLGLVRADAGSVRLLGHDVPDDLTRVIGHVGALVETPLFVPASSGRRNLELLARVGGVGPERIEECLELVDPARARHRPVRQLFPRHEAAPRHRRRAAEDHDAQAGLLTTNAIALVRGGGFTYYTYEDDPGGSVGSGYYGTIQVEHVVSNLQGGLVISGFAVLLTAVAGLFLARRVVQ